ncbi:hypothetical protein BACI71_40153 [Bacillus mycoides]|uniref:Uncharacterized protein n=1 Tax=Bacillus mycoides TaxID=1405 RepID=A0A653ZHB5_BACMY|nr:hypothetical protein BACI71_40153 [Bacillus mycoides]
METFNRQKTEFSIVELDLSSYIYLLISLSVGKTIAAII